MIVKWHNERKARTLLRPRREHSWPKFKCKYSFEGEGENNATPTLVKCFLNVCQMRTKRLLNADANEIGICRAQEVKAWGD